MPADRAGARAGRHRPMARTFAPHQTSAAGTARRRTEPQMAGRTKRRSACILQLLIGTTTTTTTLSRIDVAAARRSGQVPWERKETERRGRTRGDTEKDREPGDGTGPELFYAAAAAAAAVLQHSAVAARYRKLRALAALHRCTATDNSGGRPARVGLVPAGRPAGRGPVARDSRATVGRRSSPRRGLYVRGGNSFASLNRDLRSSTGNERTNGTTNEGTNKRTIKRRKKRTNKRTNERTNERKPSAPYSMVQSSDTPWHSFTVFTSSACSSSTGCFNTSIFTIHS